MTKKELITKVVKMYIDEFNPHSLLPICPEDEFDSESRAIASAISSEMSAKDICIIISKVLSSSFGGDFTIDECMPTAEKIYNKIHE